jgi:cell division protein FtsQ
MLPQLRQDPARRVARADLRYTNGFAIVWKDVVPDNPLPNPPARGGAGSESQETNA